MRIIIKKRLKNGCDILKLSDKRNVKNVLANENFTFKKSLGQNFIIDDSVCPAMAEAAADENTGVLEIGPGAGVLTMELSKCAKRVVSIEIDTRLESVLSKTLENCDNVKIIFGDVMKLPLRDIIEENFKDCEKVTVCANLPYYITSPVIMGLLEAKLPVKSITVMVQKEAALRLTAQVGSKNAGAVTAAVRYYSEPKMLFEVPRTSFMPAPKVDSAVIKLDVLEKPPVAVSDEKFFFSLVKSCFAQRRKTLLNTVSNTLGVDKEILKNALAEMGLCESIRAEALDMRQLAELCEYLIKNK